MSKIAIIGAGNMGGAISGRLHTSGNEITVTAAHESTLERLRQNCTGIKTTTDNRSAVNNADIVILAVKPWLIDTVISEIRSSLPQKCIVMSVAATVTLEDLTHMLDRDDIAVYRAIPNTPVAIGKGVTFICTADENPYNLEAVKTAMEPLGAVHVVDEGHLDAAMAVSSCGVAYILRYIRATMEGAIQLGLKPDQALQWAAETIAGTAAMLLESNEHPEGAIDRVTTPGGLTIRGLNAMEANGFSNAVIKGLLASLPNQ